MAMEMDDMTMGPLLSAAGKKRAKRKGETTASPLIGLKTTMLKTSLCRHWDRGHCKYGDQCGFAHGEDELSQAAAAAAAAGLGSTPSSRQPSLLDPPEPDAAFLKQFHVAQQLQQQPQFEATNNMQWGQKDAAGAQVLPMSTLVPHLGMQPSMPSGMNVNMQQWNAAIQLQQQQLQQQQQKIQQQQQQLQQLQQQHNMQQQKLVQQQQQLQHVQVSPTPGAAQPQGAAQPLQQPQQQQPAQPQQQQQHLPRNIMQQGTPLQPQPAAIPSASQAVPPQTTIQTPAPQQPSLNDSIGKWSNGSPAEKPLVTSYVGLPLEHSVKASTMGGVGLANTLSIMPLANSTGLNTTQDSAKSENPLSTNPDLLHLVLSQRRTKGLIIRLGNDPLVALPSVGAFSFNYKSVKKEHSHKLQVGCKVDFRLSQTHPPRAVSLRLLGDPQNVDMNAVQEQLSEAAKNEREDGGLSQSIQSLDASVDKARLSATINSDSTPEWPTTGTLLSNWNETARTEEHGEVREVKPASVAAVAAGLCPLLVCASKMPRRNSSTRRPAVPAAEADVDAILAEILDLTDSPAGGALVPPPTQHQQPCNITLPPDPFPEQHSLNAAAWTVGLGGLDTKAWNTDTTTSIHNLAATLSALPLSQTFPPPGTNPAQPQRRQNRFPQTSALELQVMKIQLETLFPKQMEPVHGEEWWTTLTPQNEQVWPRLLSVYNIVESFPQLLDLKMGVADVKGVMYNAVAQYTQLNQFPEVDPFGYSCGQLSSDSNAAAIVEAVAAKKRLTAGQVKDVSIRSYVIALTHVFAQEHEKVTANNASPSDISLRETQASASRKLTYVLHSYEP